MNVDLSSEDISTRQKTTEEDTIHNNKKTQTGWTTERSRNQQTSYHIPCI